MEPKTEREKVRRNGIKRKKLTAGYQYDAWRSMRERGVDTPDDPCPCRKFFYVFKSVTEKRRFSAVLFEKIRTLPLSRCRHFQSALPARADPKTFLNCTLYYVCRTLDVDNHPCDSFFAYHNIIYKGRDGIHTRVFGSCPDVWTPIQKLSTKRVKRDVPNSA